jgi:radical SAM family uncharacterized protein
MLEDILLQVNKPGRYIGGEWNSPKKDFDKAYIKFALSFPDLYEVGMSNLGLRILYGILNNIPDTCCERVFACDCDMENILRDKRMEIFSLESRRGLREFDIIGFSLGSELNYTNVLNILDLGCVPLQASLRDHNYPLVIGGGPCALNPEPLHEFFDLFVIGEAEDLIPELIETYGRYKEKFKAGKISKQDLLFIFSQIEGVYAPSLYEAVYNTTGAPEEFKPKIKDVPVKIKKRFVADLNSCFFPLEWLLPYIQIVHDRLNIEIMRGCPNRCRFCQARSQYFPLRLRDIRNILMMSSATYKRTGYEEISLCGLSVSDYPGIEELLKGLTDLFRHKAVGVSLPSIKPREMVGGLSSLIAGTRKTGLTFAPEAGSERLRKIIAKDFDEEDFFRALEEAYLSGYQHVKLYFMIGLPREEKEDLTAIIDLSNRVSGLRRKLTKMPAQVNVSINTLIPKPHTPLQWLGMEDMDSIKCKQDYLKAAVKKHLPAGRQGRLKLSFHNRYMSFLEGVFSRGDRRLSRVISCAFKKGARFDAWGHRFSFDKWWAAFEETGIDPLFYLKEKKEDGLLPWDFIDVGINKETLADEFKNLRK